MKKLILSLSLIVSLASSAQAPLRIVTNIMVSKPEDGIYFYMANRCESHFWFRFDFVTKGKVSSFNF